MHNIFKLLMRTFSNKEVEERRDLYKALFLSPVGQEVLKDLMKQSSMFSANVLGGDLKFTEGKRSLVYYILHKLYNEEVEPAILGDLKHDR